MAGPNNASNPLGADSLSSVMAVSLPTSQEPQLKTPYDAVSLAVHAGMIAVGFRLVGLGEDHRVEPKSDANNLQQLPTEWNASPNYAFRYAHSQSSMEYVIKITRLGANAVVFGIAVGDDKTTSFDISVKDYISESSIPSTPASAGVATEDAARTLQTIFISPSRLSDFGSLLKISIIQKLAPGLHKEGYEETSTGNSPRNESEHDPNIAREGPRQPRVPPPTEPEPARPYPFNDPLAIRPDPGRPLPEPIPGFEDEYEVYQPPRGFGRNDSNLPSIGQNDLYPPGLGPHDPLRPHFGGGGRIPGIGGEGGGMHPTFDDPLFGGQEQGQRQGLNPTVPPGSRYDPIGPAGAPRDNRMGPRFPGGGGGLGGGRPPNPFDGYGSGDFL